MIDKTTITKSRFIENITSAHKGYVYDMPVVRHTLSGFTTFVETPMVFNISNKKII